MWELRETGWLREVSALSSTSMQGRGVLKKSLRVRENNGALQVRLRLAVRDHFTNRLGRFDNSIAQARGQTSWVDFELDFI